jgi:L-rhamnose-H+ transport protein
MLNYAFAFGQDIAKAAVEAGNTEIRAAYAVWPIALAGGFLPNIAYSAWLLTMNRTWDRFVPGAGESKLAVLMAVFWMGSMAVYGVAAIFLGVLGTSIGWALFQIFMIMTANTSGMITGEWRHSPHSTRAIFWTGFGLLALATVVISVGNVGA